MEKIAFLHHIVSREGTSVDPKKVEAMLDWSIPKSVTEIPSYLRMIGYYKRFVQDLSKIVGSLMKLTRKGV